MNKHNTVIYIGVTNDLARRISEHKQKLIKGFTEKYNLDKLVYYEHFTQIKDAISREKCLKGWRRERKIELIKKVNSAEAFLKVSKLIIKSTFFTFRFKIVLKYKNIIWIRFFDNLK